MRRVCLPALFVLSLLAAQAPTPALAQKSDPTVYVTRTGDRYHRDGCRYLRTSKIAKRLSEAKLVRDFAHVVNREKAPVGAMLTLEPPTRGMEQEAATAGTIESHGQRVNRLQLLPIGELLERKTGLRIPDGYSLPPSRYRTQGILFGS